MGAITTTYNGIEYRSRLEARWAAFMSNIGWEHTYEPFDGDGYIPDFIVHGKRPMLIEVKPAMTLRDYKDPVAKVTKGVSDYPYDVLIVGMSPFPKISTYEYFPDAGWFGERMEWDGGELSWDVGQWITCMECTSIAVFHLVMSYGGRPCWCTSGGDHHMGTPPKSIMESMWADACNSVKWRGKPS